MTDAPAVPALPDPIAELRRRLAEAAASDAPMGLGARAVIKVKAIAPEVFAVKRTRA